MRASSLARHHRHCHRPCLCIAEHERPQAAGGQLGGCCYGHCAVYVCAAGSAACVSRRPPFLHAHSPSLTAADNDEVPGQDVRGICSIMTQSGVLPVDAFAQVVKASLAGAPCMDNSYTDFVTQLRNTSFASSTTGVGARQWTWQTCTRMYPSAPARLCVRMCAIDAASDTRRRPRVNACRVRLLPDVRGKHAVPLLHAHGPAVAVAAVHGCV